MRLGSSIAALLLVASCGGVEPTTSEQLAGRFIYELLDGTGPAGFEVTGLDDGALAQGPLVVRQTLYLDAMVDLGLPGLEDIRRVSVPLLGRAGAASGVERALALAEGRELPGRSDAEQEAQAHRLFQGTRELTYVPLPDQLDDAAIAEAAAAFPEGGFSVLPGELVLRPYPDDEGELVYHALVDPAVDPQGMPRVDLDGSSYQGFSIPAGVRVDLGELTWTEGAELSFGFTGRGRLQLPSMQALVLKTLVDGQPVGRDRVVPLQRNATPPPEHHLAPLPGTGGRVTLEVSGHPGEMLVLAPAITRPRAASERPDLVVFLADTFRADNLAVGGGDPRIAPNINAFAAGNVAFERAWSTASWTLPSQASLLTGLMPPRHGAVFEQLALDERHLTLGEHLAAAGYRTVAVTESGFVVPAFGMDQGFEEFLVGPPTDLDATLARVAEVLARDDGRPLFLYVQTFRAHHAYVATDDARAALPELFADAHVDHGWHFQTMMDAIAGDVGDARFLDPEGTNAVMADEVLAHPGLAELEALYRGGSWDLDRGFGTFLGMLDEAGLGDAPLVLTSDHGEAFGEHGIAGHGNAPYEEQLWIPLVVRAPGAAAAVLEAPASLVDLGPTLCELADLPVPAFWEGRSLVPLWAGGEAPEAAPLVAYESPMHKSGLPAEVTLRAGDRKVIATLDAQGKVVADSLRAHDLAADPLEERALGPSDAPWAAALGEALEARLAELASPRFPPRSIHLTPEAEAELRAMGYLGDEEEQPPVEDEVDLRDTGYPAGD